ncbi:MAG TPA: hypothetical protein VKU01_14540 [Bryobacteraceae bacterium]|nr:hypothetical protein [Bryobacteraceae bacterium]
MLSKSWLWKIALALPVASMAWGGTFGRVVPIGGQSADIALDENRGVLYIANFTANRIDVMSLSTYQIQTSINVDPQPNSLSLSPDGHYLVVTHYGAFAAPAPPTNSLTVIDLTTNGKQTFALANPPLGVAFGIDGLALVVTTSDYILFDPVLGISTEVDTIAGVVAKTLPVPPASFPPNITNASVATSADGLTIYGMGGSTGTFTFRYDVTSRTVYSGGIVIASGNYGPRVVSVNSDGSLVIAGWTMITTRNGLFSNLLTSNNTYNIGSTVFDDSRNVVYAQMPGSGPPILQIVDTDSFAVLQQLQLPENLGGKSLLSSDSNTVYAVSDSGVIILPVGSLSAVPRVTASQADLIFSGNFCNRQSTSQNLSITDPGGGHTPFQIVSTTAGVTVSPTSGVTPQTVKVTVDPNAFAGQQGTVTGSLQITSTQAVNVPNNVRVLINTRQPDQRGTVVDIPGTLVDLLADPTRDRFYVLRQDTNQVLVYDAAKYTQIATFKTGNVPQGMAITMDGSYLLVANSRSEMMTVIDLDALQLSDPISIQNYTANSVAVSANAILVAAVDFQGKGHIIRINFSARTATQPASLGVFSNTIDPNSVVVASPNGASILVAEPSGGVMLYDANADSFIASRQDFKALAGSYAASSFGQYVVGNNLLNSSLVPVLQFDTSTGSPSGFAFVDQFAYRTGVPVPSGGTGSGSGSSSGTAYSSVAGIIQRLDLGNDAGGISLATRMTEAPLLPAGNIPFTRTIAPLYSRNAIINLTVSGFTVLPWQYDASVAPPSISSVVNAADGRPAIAPGGLISIFGSQFSPINVATSDIPVPTALADSCLTVNGLPMPIFFVSPNQINAQMPFEAIGNVTMVVHTPGGVSNNYNTTIMPGAPSIFRTGTAGPETDIPTIVRAANGELVTDSNPVHRNDTLSIYLTGLGTVYPAVATGMPSPSDPLSSAINTPTVTLGGVNLGLTFAGLTPNQVGVYQINVTVPKTVPIDSWYPLTINQAGMSTTLQVRVIQ